MRNKPIKPKSKEAGKGPQPRKYNISKRDANYDIINWNSKEKKK